MKKKSGFLSQSLIVLVIVVVLFPVLFMLANSFVGESEIMKNYGSLITGNQSARTGLRLIPERVTLEGYFKVFLLSPRYLIKFWNSLLLTCSIVLGQVIISSLAGYGLAKFHFRGKEFFVFLVMILTLIPQQVTLVTGFMVLDRFGLIGSYSAIILPGLFATFGTFLLSQVFSGVPDSLLEAAEMDGANAWYLFIKIAIPYAKIGIAALAILSFIDNWNMVEQPLIYLRNPNKYPLSVFLSLINENALGVSFVCGVLAILPVALLFFYLKNALIHGIEYSNLK